MSDSPLLLLRCDVSPVHGTGHLMRAVAFAETWRRRGGRAEFVTCSDLSPYRAWLGETPVVHAVAERGGTPQEAAATRALAETLGAVWLAADGYDYDAAWQEGFGEGRCRLLLMDDYGHGTPYRADCVLNQNPGADASLYAARRPETRLLLGPRYALLRPPFARWRGWLRETPERAGRLLVTFGGTDPAGLTVRAAEALRGTNLEAEVVVGAGNSRGAEVEALCAGTRLRVRRHVLDMPALMAECDFVLGAAGSTSLECAFMQLPQILVTTAANQIGLAAALVEAGAGELLGWHPEVSGAQIATAVQRLAEDPARRAAMSAAGSALLDGWGADRACTHLHAQLLTLREVAASDERPTWEWANDPVTRASFLNTALIPWETHRSWFEARRHDPQAFLRIGEDARGEPLGLVRFSWGEAASEADVSLVVAPAARGRGHGAAMLLRASHELLRQGWVEGIQALIRPENAASRTAFLRAGYCPAGSAKAGSIPVDRFVLRASDVPAYERL